MEPLYYPRVAMSGWLYLAVLLSSLYLSDSPYWKDLYAAAVTQNSFTVIALAAVAGIGVPPAFGFILEKFASLLMNILGSSYSSYEEVTQFPTGNSRVRGVNWPSIGMFHAIFYSNADSKLIEWARRRRTNQYACVTGILAIFLGLTSTLYLHAYSIPVILSSFLIIAVLGITAIREGKMHYVTTASWIYNYLAINPHTTPEPH